MQSESLVMQVNTAMKKLLWREIIPTGEDYCDNVRKDQNAGRLKMSDKFATWSVLTQEQSPCSAFHKELVKCEFGP